jgi:hypothetical protein
MREIRQRGSAARDRDRYFMQISEKRTLLTSGCAASRNRRGAMSVNWGTGVKARPYRGLIHRRMTEMSRP